MESVRLMLDVSYGDYSCVDNSNLKMLILGSFFVSDVGCRGSIFGAWADLSTDGDCCSGNITRLEIEGDYVLMTDLYPEIPAELKMGKKQFVKLFDEWFEKVCKIKPKEVMIIYDSDKDEFRIETKN